MKEQLLNLKKNQQKWESHHSNMHGYWINLKQKEKEESQ